MDRPSATKASGVDGSAGVVLRMID